ncbi:helix-turn-helix domain-containing protein [Micromonospora aurantiaca (nom. illeg.)]|uniref:helix-turn-helix domain-containing protein n=1 Tax=Micromonospora aurantiaca (nom. illeg.) TaxID=47850 RepID=UPI0033F1894F
MGRRPSTLTPNVSPRHFLGAELRRWRELRGLSIAELAGAVFVSPALVSKVEKAQRTATVTLIRSCDAALDTGGALERLLDFVEHLPLQAVPTGESPRPAPRAVPTGESPRPVAVRLTVTAEIEPVQAAEDRTGADGGGARVYFLGERRRGHGGQ